VALHRRRLRQPAALDWFAEIDDSSAAPLSTVSRGAGLHNDPHEAARWPTTPSVKEMPRPSSVRWSSRGVYWVLRSSVRRPVATLESAVSQLRTGEDPAASRIRS
jgi:hypothetical protein